MIEFPMMVTTLRLKYPLFFIFTQKNDDKVVKRCKGVYNEIDLINALIAQLDRALVF